MLSHTKFQEHFKKKINRAALSKDSTKETNSENYIPEANETEVVPGITRELEDKEEIPPEPLNVELGDVKILEGENTIKVGRHNIGFVNKNVLRATAAKLYRDTVGLDPDDIEFESSSFVANRANKKYNTLKSFEDVA